MSVVARQHEGQHRFAVVAGVGAENRTEDARMALGVVAVLAHGADPHLETEGVLRMVGGAGAPQGVMCHPQHVPQARVLGLHPVVGPGQGD